MTTGTPSERTGMQYCHQFLRLNQEISSRMKFLIPIRFPICIAIIKLQYRHSFTLILVPVDVSMMPAGPPSKRTRIKLRTFHQAYIYVPNWDAGGHSAAKIILKSTGGEGMGLLPPTVIKNWIRSAPKPANRSKVRSLEVSNMKSSQAHT